MQDLEPPEVPLELAQLEIPKDMIEQPKKESLFNRLFSRKSKVKDFKKESLSDPTLSDPNQPVIQTLPELELPQLDNMSNSDLMMSNSKDQTNDPYKGVNDYFQLPTSLPNPTAGLGDELKKLYDETKNTDKKKNKSKGKLKKGQKKEVDKIDESSKFDWAREISAQELLIHTSNRFNQDVNTLLEQTDAHIDKNTSLAKNDSLVSEHMDSTPSLEPITVDKYSPIPLQPKMQNTNIVEMPPVDEEDRKAFTKISMSHQRLRSMLSKYLNNKKLFENKQKMIALFKMYDESIEKKIEDKELSLSRQRKELENFESHLKEQDSELKKVHTYIKGLDAKLKKRESELNNIIAKDVEKELVRRLKVDRNKLREELRNTVILNKTLKSKLTLIEEHKIKFDKEHQKLMESERKKLNELQVMYEQKLKDLEADRRELNSQKKIFNDKRSVALDLLNKADAVSKELQEVKNLQDNVVRTKDDLVKTKKAVDSELAEDKELKSAIEKAQARLLQEKENLDNMVFSKYIETKLKTIKPEYLESRDDWKNALKSNPLYEQIGLCKRLLAQHNLTEAKALYNTIRKSYDQANLSKKEKAALYTAIRELYNDIQLRIVESQISAR